MNACEKGSLSEASSLIEQGADIDESDVWVCAVVHGLMYKSIVCVSVHVRTN